MLFTARIKELEGQLTAALGNVAALTQEKADLEAKLAHSGSTAGAMISKADHDAAMKQQAERIAELTAEAEAARGDASNQVDSEVIKRLADAGVDPIRRSSAADTGTPGAQSHLDGMAKARAYFATRQPSEESPAA